MIISDLIFLELAESSLESIIGGVSASANTQASAQPGLGSANGNAIALGPKTSTTTQTNTVVYVDPLASITDAGANADARASDGNNSALASSTSNVFLIIN